MTVNLRQKGFDALAQMPERYLPVIIRWLELLAAAKDNPDVEPEELWLLVTGKLKLLIDDMDGAYDIYDWQKIRELHPHNWVVVWALDGRTEKGQRIINQFVLMDVCGDDWKAAWERYKELHAADKWKEYYVLHTDREELNIEVMNSFRYPITD